VKNELGSMKEIASQASQKNKYFKLGFFIVWARYSRLSISFSNLSKDLCRSVRCVITFIETDRFSFQDVIEVDWRASKSLMTLLER
jgi:hypothetical protein